MLLALMLVFIAVPLLEIAVLIKVGNLIDFWPTLALVIGTAILGTAIMRAQGLKALMNAQTSMGKGQLPVESVIDGAFLLVAGAFLLTPGLITDSIGFLFLVPPFRRWFARWGFRKFTDSNNVRASVFTQSTHSEPPGNDRSTGPNTSDPQSGHHNAPGNDTGTVIDGEFERLDEKPIPPHRKRKR